MKTFEVPTCGNVKNTLKINYYRKTLSFGQYLCNERLDHHEILNFSSHDINEWIQIFWGEEKVYVKKGWVQECFGIKIFLSLKILSIFFVIQNILVQKNFVGQKNGGPKKYGSKNNLHKKSSVPEILFFGAKNLY